MALTSGELAPTVTHSFHPAHPLSVCKNPVNACRFTCGVCKQWGEGSEHYQCDPCNHNVHAVCATAPATLKNVYYTGDFTLYSSSGPGDPERYCDVCGRQVLGYRYHNPVGEWRLHPCCAFLPPRVVQDGRAFQLGNHPSGVCGMCRKKSTKSLTYRSTYDDGEDLYLHVSCLVDTNNRVTGYQDWVASAPIRPGVLGSFTRNKEGSGDLMKAAKVSFNIARIVYHVATLDVGGIVDAAQNVAEVFE